MRRTILIAAVLLAFSCGGEDRSTLVVLPSTPGALFTGAGAEAVVATVGDWKITEADLLAVHPVRPGATLEDSLQGLVARTVAVRAATLADFEPRFEVLLAWRKALARRWISWRFTEVFRPDTIPEEMLRAVWEVKWFLWDHMNTYYVVDAQIICCHGHPSECDKQDVVRCQDEHQEFMEGLHRRLVEEDVREQTVFHSVTEHFSEQFDVSTGFVKYAFQYDHSKPYSEQRGYDLFDEAITLGVEGLNVNHFTPVLRSVHGLHILFLYKFLPEVHKTLADPEVRAEISEKAYPALQEGEVAKEFGHLTGSGDIRLFPEILEQVEWPKVTGIKQ